MARFRYHVPVSTFEKADAPEGERRRIGGILSTETRDADGEVILQDGLNFTSFLNDGWFNENHNGRPQAVLGYPDAVQKFDAGQVLPNGEIAQTKLTWGEGYLIPGYKPADDIWELSQSLAKNNMKRKLAFSIEGAVTKRDMRDRKLVLAADVDHVAITHCPKNRDSILVAMQKAMTMESDDPASLPNALPGGRADGVSPLNFDAAALDEGAQHELEHTTDVAIAREIAMDHLVEDPDYYKKLKRVEAQKALTTAGGTSDPQNAGQPGSGGAMIPESLAGAPRKKERLTRSQAILDVLDYFPSATPDMAATIVDMIAQGAIGRN